MTTRTPAKCLTLVEEDDVAVTATGDFIGNDATAADI